MQGHEKDGKKYFLPHHLHPKTHIDSTFHNLAMKLGLVLLGILIAFLVFLLHENQRLNSALEHAQLEKSMLEKELYDVKQQAAMLNRTLLATREELGLAKEKIDFQQAIIEKIKKENDKLNSSINNLSSVLKSKELRLEELTQQYENLILQINQSISWFKENSVFPASHSQSTRIFRERLYKDCLDYDSLNLACVAYLMENTAFSLHYRKDAEGKSKKEDKLQSLAETIDSGWGDCEDYSLLVKSILNMVKSERVAKSMHGFAPSESGIFRIYPLESKSSPNEDYWYYGKAKRKEFGNFSESNFYVVCYNQAYPQPGHCVVAISPNKVSIDGVHSELDGAILFEPQNGEYLGRANDGVFSVCNKKCEREPLQIYLIISDDDLFIHDGENWSSYKSYMQQALHIFQ